MTEIGSAVVSIMPSARGFGRSLASQVGGDVDKVGKSFGSRFGSSFTSAFKVGGLTAGVPSAPLFRVGPEELG